MSILPFPTILDDIKEKGFRRTLFETADSVVQRLTAGMNVQDLREALRGEKPSRRPNPRLQPHADGFWLHMRPSYFHQDMTGLYPTFRLGWLSTYFVFFETITGIILMFWYTPSPDIAYGNMLNILGNVPLGQLVRDLHRLGAEAMVLIVALHMMRTLFTGSYKKPRQFTWFTGVILLVVTGLLSFTGYLLPWDQLALWAVTIGASMAEATPVIGQEVNLIVRGAPELGANGLLRFYLVHVLALPAFLFIFTGVHYYKVIIHGHSLPPKKENIGEDTAKRVPLDKRVYFIPDILTSELLWIGVTTFILIMLSIWFYHAPLENHADPQVTPLGTTAPWYFLWIQGALKLGDKFFMGILFPTVLLGVLAVIPYVDIAPSRRFKDRRIMITFGLLLISFITVLSYMGLPKFGVATSPDTEVLHLIIKEPAHNDVGLIRPVPFEQLVVGAYTTREVFAEEGQETASVNAFDAEIKQNGQFALMEDQLVKEKHIPEMPRGFKPVPADAPELRAVMEEFAHMLAEADVELLNAWGAIIITQNQANLKRVDVVITWDEVQVEAGKPVLDEHGDPVVVPAQVPLLDADGNEVKQPALDGNGDPKLDENGNPLEETVMVDKVDENGNVVANRRIASETIFLHEDSQYFRAPGR
jgi:ubiquinol-cytochrome c reductase cytochrome b subunit